MAGQLLFYYRAEVVVNRRSQYFPGTDEQRDIQAQPAERLCHLQGDIATANDEGTPWLALVQETLDGQSCLQGPKCQDSARWGTGAFGPGTIRIGTMEVVLRFEPGEERLGGTGTCRDDELVITFDELAPPFQIANLDSLCIGIDGLYFMMYVHLYALPGHLLGGSDYEGTIVGNVARDQIGHAAGSIRDERAPLIDYGF
jgi:hypothetical protein